MRKTIRLFFLVVMTTSLVGCTTSKNASSTSSGSEPRNIKEIWERDITNYGLLDKNSNVTIDAANGIDQYIAKVDNGKIESIINSGADYFEYVSGIFPEKYVFNYYYLEYGVGYKKNVINIYLTDLIDICGLPPIPFEDVTYDKDKDQYVAEEITMTLQEWSFTIVDVVVKFVNNKVSKISYKQFFKDSEEKGETCTLEFSNYGKTSVTLPDIS